MRKSSPTIRARLVTLVLALVLPFVAIAALGAVLLWSSGRAALERDLLYRAQALAAVVEQELGTAKAILQTLATSPYLEADDLEGFHRQLGRTVRQEGTRIVLSDATGQMLVNSIMPFGPALPRRGDVGVVQRVFETGQAQVSDLYIGPITREPLIAIDVPVFRGGQVVYDLNIGFRASDISRALQQQRPPKSNWVATVFDSQLSVVARAPEMDGYLGRKASPEGQRAFQQGNRGVYRAPGLDGEPSVAAFSRLPSSGWVAVAVVREATIMAELWRSLAVVGVSGGILLLLGLLAALRQSERIAKSVESLAASPGKAVEHGVREVEEVARALKLIERDREQALGALHQSEARLQAIFDTAPVGIIIGEAPSGRIVSGNTRAEQIFGHPILYSPDVEHYGEWVAFHPDGRRVGSRDYPLARALAGEERPELEALYQRGDGARRWLRFIAAPICRGAQIVGAVVVTLDIDHEIRSIEELARAREGLEVQVREEVAAREAAQARLAQAEKLTALGQLAGGIAHDFNNVLQAASGGASLIGRHAGDPATVKRLAQMVEDAARRGTSVTRRLLSFARRGELRAEAVDVPLLLEGLREVLAHTLGASIIVELDVSSETLPVIADRSQLETALVNLATNGRDAMPEGGTLTLSVASETVETGLHAASLSPGPYVRISVTDTGMGMDAATLTRVMEPFFTTKPQGKGTGLGLPMARGFAEQSGGGLEIRSDAGHGTTVTIWLPIAPMGLIGSFPKPPSEFAALPKSEVSRILLVDDEAIVREMIAADLTDRGYEVVQAEGGATALALLSMGQPVDLLVTDLSMPEMNGVTLIQEVQRRRSQLPAILLTGYAGEDATLAVGGAVSGAFSLLRKPVTGAHLADRIATLLEMKTRV